jgi:hypothetical protein
MKFAFVLLLLALPLRGIQVTAYPYRYVVYFDQYVNNPLVCDSLPVTSPKTLVVNTHMHRRTVSTLHTLPMSSLRLQARHSLSRTLLASMSLS